MIGKKEIKLYPLTDGIFVYIEKSKKHTNEPLKILHEFSKGTGYKVNIQKFIVFLHTSNEHLEFKIFKYHLKYLPKQNI